MLRCRLVKRNPKDVLLLVYVWGASSPSDASKSDSETINAGGGPPALQRELRKSDLLGLTKAGPGGSVSAVAPQC